MAESPISRMVTVSNPKGLHLRDALALAQLVRGFRAKVMIQKNQDRVDCSDPFQTLMLVALENEELLLEASGQDAEEALEATARLFARGADEDAQIENN